MSGSDYAIYLLTRRLEDSSVTVRCVDCGASATVPFSEQVKDAGLPHESETGMLVRLAARTLKHAEDCVIVKLDQLGHQKQQLLDEVRQIEAQERQLLQERQQRGASAMSGGDVNRR